MFGADSEGLLPVHYVAERADKDQHLDLLQFIVEVGSSSGRGDGDVNLVFFAESATMITICVCAAISII